LACSRCARSSGYPRFATIASPSRESEPMHRLCRIAALTAFAASLACAWTMSVEFPWPNLPRAIWEQQLAHLKEMGVAHVSLPQSQNTAQLDEVISIVRHLGLEAD